MRLFLLFQEPIAVVEHAFGLIFFRGEVFMEGQGVDFTEPDRVADGNCIECFINPHRLRHLYNGNIRSCGHSHGVVPEVRWKNDKAVDGLIKFLRDDITDNERLQGRTELNCEPRWP